MGIIDSVKSAFGGSSDEEVYEEVEDDWEFEEEEDDFEEEDDEWDDDEEEEELEEFDTYYQAMDEVAQRMGFGGLQEFAIKAAVWRLNNSNMYRDRFESGAQTARLLNETVEETRAALGGGNNDKEWSEIAEDIKGAKEFTKEVEDLAGVDEEERMANNMIFTANRAIDALRDISGAGGAEGGGSGIASSGVSEEEL